MTPDLLDLLLDKSNLRPEDAEVVRANILPVIATDKAFHDMAIKQRNYAWQKIERLEAELALAKIDVNP